MSQIIEGLYIGSFADAKNKKFLTDARITHILSAAWELQPSFPDMYEYLHVKLSDKPTFDLTIHLNGAVEFIERALQAGGRVLVHCYAGISRSASCVIAYLIRIRKLSFESALNLCQAKRPQVKPNKGFQDKLALYEQGHSGNEEVIPLPSPSLSSRSPVTVKYPKSPLLPPSFNVFAEDKVF